MKLKKAMILLGTVCILNTMIVGCSSSSESVAKTEENQAGESSPEAPQENTAGKWQVLEPEVWKMEEDSFFIAEKKVTILDDGSRSYSSPGSNADIPDSQLIHVVFEEDTVFYRRTTDGNGENHEDKEAEFQDLKEHMTVEMKGSFKNDEFHATEIRFF